MTDVTEATIEVEDDTDLTQDLSVTLGLVSVGSVTLADATTTATTGAVGEAATTSTAEPQTTASTTTTSAGAATSTASATTTATTVVPDATVDNPPVDFRVTRDGSTVEDAVYDVSPLTDTANPFGDFVVIKIDDRGGQKFENYERGTRIDVDITENFGITYTERFTGYVVERRELDQQGADALEVEAYSFDQFLRRNTVSNDQTGNLISEALADIIQTDTPVDYTAANIEVGEDQTLTRGYQGENVETVLRDLAFKSTNEEFGVNDDLEFFFRPRETRHIDRGIDNTLWFNYDIPELGKETINEVEVWFDDGNESVIVDDGTDKLDLQDSLGLSSPGTQRAELNRPLITDISDAEDIGRKYLTFRNATLSGTVTTYGLYDAEPGDTIDVTIDPRGIDTEFVIAAIRYRWGVDETEVTIVENRGDVDDILADLSDSVQRQEMEGADRDAPKNRITTTNARAIITPDWTVDGTSAGDRRVANAGRNSIRDGWIGDGNPDVAEIRVGDDNTGLSRSNTGLVNQTATAAASETLPSSTTVEYTATLTQAGVSEVGLFESDGTLITRATLDSPVDVDGDVTVSLSVANDPDVSRGVLTTGGQTAVRDVLADNSPAIPDEYGYGSDGTTVAESDTALGNELVRVGLKEITIQEADTDSEWNSITSLAADTPLEVTGGALDTTQVAFVAEAEALSGSFLIFTADRFSDGDVAAFESSGQFFTLDFSVSHTIPASAVGVYLRIETEDPGPGPEIDCSLNGDTWTPIGDQTTFGNVGWEDVANNTFGGTSTYSGGDLTPGSYTLEVEAQTNSTSEHWFDVAAVVDTRFVPGPGSVDNTVNQAQGYLDGPNLFPDQTVTSLSTAVTRRLVDEARFDSVWNDITNNQYVELANDGSTFTRFNNADSGTATFAAQEENVDTNVALSNYPQGTNPQTATPRFGYNGQAIDTWNLFATIEAVATDDIGESLTRAIVAPDTITGSTVREAGLFGDGTLLTRHELAAFDVLAGQRIASSETTRILGPTT
jgi:hypothetical protein